MEGMSDEAWLEQLTWKLLDAAAKAHPDEYAAAESGFDFAGPSKSDLIMLLRDIHATNAAFALFRSDLQNTMLRSADKQAKSLIDAHERIVFWRHWTEKWLTDSGDGVQVFTRLTDPGRFLHGRVRFCGGPIGQKNKLRVELKGKVNFTDDVTDPEGLDLHNYSNLALAMKQGLVVTWSRRNHEWTVTLKHNPVLVDKFDNGDIVLDFTAQRRAAILGAQKAAFADHDLDIDADDDSTILLKLGDRLPPESKHLRKHVLTKFSVDDGAVSQKGFELMMLPHFQLASHLKHALPFFPAPLLSCVQLYCFWPVNGKL